MRDRWSVIGIIALRNVLVRSEDGFRRHRGARPRRVRPRGFWHVLRNVYHRWRQRGRQTRRELVKQASIKPRDFAGHAVHEDAVQHEPSQF